MRKGIKNISVKVIYLREEGEEKIKRGNGKNHWKRIIAEHLKGKEDHARDRNRCHVSQEFK